jgi:hypothetical protein
VKQQPRKTSPPPRRNPAVLVVLGLVILLGLGFGASVRLWPKRPAPAAARAP